MAEMHVRGGDGQQWTVIMHLAVPDVNNEVGINYRSALVASGIGGTTKMAEGTEAWEITTAEKGNVETGIVYEHAASFPVESGGTTTPQLRATLQEFYAAEKIRVIDVLKSRLRYYGHVENEV